MSAVLHELPETPEWEGIKTISCFCGGRLETITDDFSIEAQDRIGDKEIVRCAVCGDEYDADDQERLEAQSQRHSATTAQPRTLCA